MPSDNDLMDILAPIKARPTLAARGFKYDPCAFPNAEELDQLNDPKLADEILQDLFVEYPGLGTVMDTSKSTVLLAASGDGKTATLLRLKEYLVKRRQEFSRVYQDREPTRASNWPYRPFVVVYDRFPEMRSGRMPTIEDHLEPFLYAVANDMWLIMKHLRDYPSGLYELNESERGQAKEWWWAFLRHYLLTINLGLETQPFPRLNGDWMASPNRSDPLSRHRSFLSVLELLEEKIQKLGFDSLFVLVDNVDGNEQSQPEENTFTLIHPLLNATAVLSRQRTKFKFFLPVLFQDVVVQSQGGKKGRFDVITLSWEYDQFIDLLQSRFKWASKGRFTTIDDLSNGPFPSGISLEKAFITFVLEQFEGRPRTAIRLLDKLLGYLDDKGFLTWTNWQAFQKQEKIIREGNQLETFDNQERLGISFNLNEHLRRVLKACGPFSSNRELRNIFVNELLSPWRDNLPEANSVDERVDGTIAYLLEKYHTRGTNALVVLLRVLSQRVHPQDSCHHLLLRQADALERELKGLKLEGGFVSSYEEATLVRLDEVLALIKSLDARVSEINVSLPELQQAIILHYDQSQIPFVSQVVDRVNTAYIAGLERLLSKLDDVQTNQIPAAELQELLRLVQEDLTTRKQQGQLQSEEEEVLKTIKNPEIDFKHKLKVTLPLFFFPLVTYETEVELSAGYRRIEVLHRLLDKIWGRVTSP